MAEGLSVGEAFVTIRPDTTGFADQTSEGIQGSMGAIVKGIGAYAIGTKVKDFLGDALAAATENFKVGAQTEAVIKSTGQAAGVTAVQIGNLANALSKKAGIDDELIQSGQNVLLTFTNIRNEAGKGNDVFDRATKASLDLSVAMGTDMQSAALQVGKALNDPIQGVAALRRVGVQLSDSQEQQVKDFMAVGDAASAQKIILDELTREFGGSAAAQATAADKMKVGYENLKESIGTALLPVIEKLGKVLMPLFQYLQDHQGVLLTVAGIIGGALVAAFVAWTISALQAAAATIAATWPVLAIGAAVAALVAIVLYVWTHWNQVWNWIKDHPAYAIIVAVIFPMIANIVALVLIVRYLYDNWDSIWGKIKDITGIVVDAIKPYFEAIVDAIQWVIDAAAWLGNAVWDGMNAVYGAIRWIVDKWSEFAVSVRNAVDDAVGFVLGMPDRLLGIGESVAKAIGNGFVSAWNGIAGAINSVIPDSILGVDVPQIPKLQRFHQGGIVPGLPGQEVLAVLEAGEKVTPASQVAAPTGGGGGLTVMGDLVIQDRDVLGTLDYWSRTRLAGV